MSTQTNNLNNFIAGMQTLFSDFFNKYLENKITPVYDQLNSNPEQLFNFIEYISNYSSNVQSNSNMQSNSDANCNFNVENLQKNYKNIKEDKHKSFKKEKFSNKSVKSTDSENSNSDTDNDDIDDDEQQFNIYSNLNTVEKHLNTIGSTTIYDESETKIIKNWNLRKYPFDLMTDEQKKTNLIWTFEKFNTKQNVMPYNLGLDGDEIINPAENMYENWQSVTEDFELFNHKNKNKKIKICELSQCTELIDSNLKQLIKWKNIAEINRMNENNNEERDNKITNSIFNDDSDINIDTSDNFKEYDNFGMYFFKNITDENNAEHTDHILFEKLIDKHRHNIQYPNRENQENNVKIDELENNIKNHEQENDSRHMGQNNDLNQANELKKIIDSIELEKNITEKNKDNYLTNNFNNLKKIDKY